MDNEIKLKNIKVACIFDIFTYEIFKDCCNLIKIYPETWKETLIEEKPNFLMVESAWEGNDSFWHNQIVGNPSDTLIEVIEWCNKHDVPTVFWNKEDPSNFLDFINTVKLFDYIFTTDANKVDEYKKYVSHNNIYTLMFSANPKIHNPIKIVDERINKCCFAGTYYQRLFPRRRERLELLMDLAIKDLGLDIYDRNLNLNMVNYTFPEKYTKYIKGTLNKDEIQLANKGYRIMLNVNIVDNSPTMFARRIFEGLASYTPVVSTDSSGVKEVFKGIVVASDDENVIHDEMVKLNNQEYYETKALQGMRLVLDDHIAINRMVYILSKLNIPHNDIVPDVALVAEVNNEFDYINAKKIFERQKYRDKKLFVVINNEELYKSINKCENIIMLNKNILKDKYKFLQLINSEYVAFINTKNYYGEYYIKDMINATLYTDAKIIGKKCFYSCKYKFINQGILSINNESQEFEYVDSLDLDKCIIKIEVLKDPNIKNIEEIMVKNTVDLFKFGYRYLSIDKFNFIKYGANLDDKCIKKVNI